MQRNKKKSKWNKNYSKDQRNKSSEHSLEGIWYDYDIIVKGLMNPLQLKNSFILGREEDMQNHILSLGQGVKKVLEKRNKMYVAFMNLEDIIKVNGKDFRSSDSCVWKISKRC